VAVADRSLRVYVVTDRRLQAGRSEVEVVAAAIAGGATAVQLRGKELTGRELVEVGRALRELTRRAGVLFLVNDRVDVALAVDADGAHVGQDDLPAAVARRLLGPGRILGVSAATPEEARAAEAAGADYLGVGSVFATATKADAGAPIGPAGLRAVVGATRLPVVAIGGITADNAVDVMAAGAAGVAVISAVVGAEDVTAAARRLAASVEAGHARRGG
jgi:thiamine-phosphate pyrophosphorylase